MSNDYNILVIDVANAVNSPLFGEESNTTKYTPTLGANSLTAQAHFLLGQKGLKASDAHDGVSPNPYCAVLVDPNVAYNDKAHSERVKTLLEEIRAQQVPVIVYSVDTLEAAQDYYGYEYGKHFDTYISKDDDSMPDARNSRNLKKLEATIDGLIASYKSVHQ